MITLDTNIVLRLITGDDAEQVGRARRIVEISGGALLQPSIVLELAWVLQSRLGRSPKETADILARFATTEGIVAPDWVARLPEAVSAGVEIDDAVHLLTADPKQPFATFDALLRRRASRLTQCPDVISP